MPYTMLPFRQARWYTEGREGNDITELVVHHWDDPAKRPTFEGTVDWLATSDRQASAHYVLEDGRICPMVRDEDTAWHAGNWYHNQHSIGIECNPRCSEGDLRTLAEFIKQKKAEYPGIKVVYGHRDVSDLSTACPGRYYEPNLVLAPYMDGVAYEAPPAQSINHSDDDLESLATRVLNGEFGNGEDRQMALGSSYQAVQDIVNRRLSGESSAPAPSSNIDDLARRAINGEFGNGEDRERALGSNYQAVQDRINVMLGETNSAPSTYLNALADAVLRGEYGDGDERRARLGDNYDAVQNLVNQKLGGYVSAPPIQASSTLPPAFDVEAVADAVIRGEYGDGDDRRARLGAMYDVVQARVDEKLS